MLQRLFSILEGRSFFSPYNREVLQFAIRGFFGARELSRQDVAAIRQVSRGQCRAVGPACRCGNRLS